ncbi:MAG: response regulator [Desulforhopalus sp.]|nr:response regulator [Desulforhopalus sp.]
MGDKVLVVDDDQEMRDLLGNLLEGEGYEVILGSNGEEAIELAEKENPQVILLDFEMPGIDGIEACKRLKSGEKTASIPIIMITAYKNKKPDAIEAGADDFVNKPFDPTELSIRIKTILRMQHLTNELEKAAAYIKEFQKNLPKP